jgi:DNA-binding NtrC family response regulator
VIVAADAVLAGCSAVMGGCAMLDAARLRLALSLDALIERDRRDTPLPERVVVVLDDEEIGRDSMAALLCDCNAEVLTASTPAEARALIRAKRPAVVVADYYLRDTTSIALLRERPAYARAVIVTGAVHTDALASIALGVRADLRDRPITPEAQRELVALVSSYLPPEIA